jgi:hypothetical protein
MQPSEVNLRAFHFYKQKEEAEKSAWRRDAHFTAQIMNASGNMKRKVKGSDLFRFNESGKAAAKKGGATVTGEDRRRQALESFRYAKSKFWGLISDKSLADLESSIT